MVVNQTDLNTCIIVTNELKIFYSVKCEMEDIICVLTIEGDTVDDCTTVKVLYSHEYLRLAQERGKLVLKPRRGFERYCKCFKNDLDSFELDLDPTAGTSGLFQEPLPKPDSRDHAKETQKLPISTEENAHSLQNATIRNLENRASHENANQNLADNVLSQGAPSLNPSSDYLDSQSVADDLQSEFSNNFIRSKPLETDGYTAESFKIDKVTNSIEIITEKHSVIFQIEKKSDNLELFDKKLWMSDTISGRKKQFDEIFSSELNLFEIVRQDKGKQLVFIPYEEVFETTQQINSKSVWKNAMGNSVNVPFPQPLCLVIFDKSRFPPYTGKFIDINSKF